MGRERDVRSEKDERDVAREDETLAKSKPTAGDGKKPKRQSEESDDTESSNGSEEDRRQRSKRRKRRSSSSSRRRRYSDSESDSDSDSESSSESEYSDSDSGSGDSESESEEERRRRRRKRRKREEREKKRRRREKERKREKVDLKKKKKKKEKKEKKGKTGAVTNSWGKFGIIREIDMWNKRPEFTAWLAEVKQVNLESLPNWEEKKMFKEYMEDYNTATFSSKKYYDLDAYHRRKMEKEMKKGVKKVVRTERTIFNDEEQRRLELMQAREKQKEQEVEVLKNAMKSGMAQAMKEQAQLREEMAYLFKIGNTEAATAIQRKLDPDVAM